MVRTVNESLLANCAFERQPELLHHSPHRSIVASDRDADAMHPQRLEQHFHQEHERLAPMALMPVLLLADVDADLGGPIEAPIR
jgi:hypothetical protein